MLRDRKARNASDKSSSQSTLENILRKFETSNTDVEPRIRNVDFFRTPNRESKSQVASKKKINQSKKKNKRTDGGGFQVALPESVLYLNKLGDMLFTSNGMTFYLRP